MNASRLSLVLLTLLAPLHVSAAQQSSADTASLGALQRAARARDPRLRQLDLLAAQSRLRAENIAADRKPSFSVDGQAQYQSDVARVPIALPGVNIKSPPHDTYDARIGSQYRIYDPSIAPRRAVERAQLAESQSRVVTSLYALRQNVNDAFFAVLRADAQRAELETTLTDLEAQISVAATRVREGTALPSEENTLRAELLRRRQTISELAAARATALDVLADLTGDSSFAATTFVLPEVDVDYARARAMVDDANGRPEVAQFARTRELLDRQRDARAAQDKPRVSAFGRAGYGRPGLNPLNDKFDTYWLAGVQVQWTPFNWGTTDRDREVLALQQQIVATEEQAFRDNLRRATRQDLQAMQRLERELASDDDIIALRESVLAEARARFTEGVITSAELVDRQTDVLAARVTRSLHRVELAQARARFLTTLGIETR